MPPAGRAPPCTRWGASRPPDPGITADAKGFRIQLTLDTEPFCVRRLVFVGSPPFEVTVTRSIFVINTKNPRMHCRETFNKPRHAASPQPSSAPLTKVFEEEGGGLEGEGETWGPPFLFPLQFFHAPISIAQSSAEEGWTRRCLRDEHGQARRPSCPHGARFPSEARRNEA